MTTKTATTRVLELGIRGMTCGSCQKRVEHALRGVPGVAEARVDLGTAQATVRYDATILQAAHLVHAVREAGYEVAPPGAAVPPKRRSCCG